MGDVRGHCMCYVIRSKLTMTLIALSLVGYLLPWLDDWFLMVTK